MRIVYSLYAIAAGVVIFGSSDASGSANPASETDNIKKTHPAQRHRDGARKGIDYQLLALK